MVKLSASLGIKDKGMITCVGAGGKSSVIQALGEEWKRGQTPFLITTTTKMFFSQVQAYAPVFCYEQSIGLRYVRKFVAQNGYASWFRGWQGIKALGLSPEWINDFYATGLVPYVLVEGDGARKRLLKAPGPSEPVIPTETDLVIGVLNLQALGKGLTPELVHRFPIVSKLLGKDYQDIIEPKDYAVLAAHSQGIFRGASGRKTLVLSGGNLEMRALGKSIVGYIQDRQETKIDACVLTCGFGTEMKVIEVLS